MNQNLQNMLVKLDSSIEKALKKPISKDRKKLLQKVIEYVQEKVDLHQTPLLNFICTHNSRRSQFSQIWAQTAAAYYGIDAQAYSGGIEITAFNERAIASLKRNGFEIDTQGELNPKYRIHFSFKTAPVIAFSKLFDDKINPIKPFAAIMTCDHADENCPLIPSSEKRISLQYEDPKRFDATPQEAEKYDERSLQIASEMFYIFKNISR